ncbi:MAG: hypothetical protein LBV27_02540 [Oscillospiraceae bacterium]|jgi:hypothetical protein|nr:hypothetical protein [Oscillospiraceae bacterium]
MSQIEKENIELKVGGITFYVVPHFMESSKDSIDSKLVNLMEQETENRMTKADSS